MVNIREVNRYKLYQHSDLFPFKVCVSYVKIENWIPCHIGLLKTVCRLIKYFHEMQVI